MRHRRDSFETDDSLVSEFVGKKEARMSGILPEKRPRQAGDRNWSPYHPTYKPVQPTINIFRFLVYWPGVDKCEFSDLVLEILGYLLQSASRSFRSPCLGGSARGVRLGSGPRSLIARLSPTGLK